MSGEPPLSALPALCPAVEARGGRKRVLILLAVLLLAGTLAALGLGAVKIPPGEVAAILAAKAGLHPPRAYSEQQETVLWAIRLPRILCGILIGAGLAVAGTVMQGLFRNPLADPGLIGVSSGAALGAVAVIVLGAKTCWTVPVAAFGGGLLAALLVHRFAWREGRTVVATLLLAGIAVNALCGAGVGFLSFTATDAQLRGITFWSLGSLGGATWTSVGMLAPLVLVPAAVLFGQHRLLNALLLGEAEAGHLGFEVETAKRLLLVGSTLIVGATVALAGAIGFIGLVVPHLLRLWTGPDHRTLLPGTALLGALLLVAADTAARLAVIPAELPIGIVTALCGAPFFLWLLRRETNRS